jgi:hypothetical protein
VAVSASQMTSGFALVAIRNSSLARGTLTAKPTVVREGAERERLYAALVEYWPDFRVYETRTARQFPVIRLDPTG